MPAGAGLCLHGAVNLRALGIGAEAEQAYVQLVPDGSPPIEPLASELRSAGLVQTVGGVDAPVSLEGVLIAWSSARAAEESATRAASEGLIALYEQYARCSSAPSVVRMLRPQRGRCGSRTAEQRGHDGDGGTDRGPFLFGPDAGLPDEQPEAMDRGVAYRTIYQSSLLSNAGLVETIGKSLAIGEDARTANDLPLRLMIADRRRALVMLPHPGVDDELRAADADGLLVESSSMLDALTRLFDTVWGRAAPLSLVNRKDPDRDPERELLLTLLPVGMTDAAIARNLGVSERTVHRRVSALAAEYGVVSRFQLGAPLERRGLLPGSTPPHPA